MICPICGSVTEAFLLNIPNWFEWVESYCEFNGHFEPHFLELIFLPPGVSPASRPSPGTPTSPSNLSTGLKTPAPAPTTSHNPLANILSKVEITPESILSALSKTQTQSAPALQGKLTCATGTWIVIVCLWLNPGFQFWSIQSHEMYNTVSSLSYLYFLSTSWHL